MLDEIGRVDRRETFDQATARATAHRGFSDNPIELADRPFFKNPDKACRPERTADYLSVSLSLDYDDPCALDRSESPLSH